jgi:hypothetical protein
MSYPVSFEIVSRNSDHPLKSFFAVLAESLLEHRSTRFNPVAALLRTIILSARGMSKPPVFQHVVFADQPWFAGDPRGRREVLRFTSTNPAPTGEEVIARYWEQKRERFAAATAEIESKGLVYSSEARGFVPPARSAFDAALQPEAAPVQSPDYLDNRRAERPRPTSPFRRAPRRDI